MPLQDTGAQGEQHWGGWGLGKAQPEASLQLPSRLTRRGGPGCGRLSPAPLTCLQTQPCSPVSASPTIKEPFRPPARLVHFSAAPELRRGRETGLLGPLKKTPRGKMFSFKVGPTFTLSAVHVSRRHGTGFTL